MRIEIEVDSTTGEASIISKVASSKPVLGIVFPYVYNDHRFESQAELETYLAAVKARDGALADWQAANDAQATVLQPGQTDIATLTGADLEFFWTFYGELAPLVGPRASVKAFADWLANSSEPACPGLPNSAGVDRVKIQGAWDWSAYHGVMRDALSKHRGVTV